MKRTVFVWLFGLMVLVGCGGTEPVAEGSVTVVTETAVPPIPTTEPTPAATATAEPTTETVTVEASDGLLIQATLYATSGPASHPGVILLHQLDSNRQIWEENGFAARLVENGYVVLAVDMRGHGETGGDKDWVLAVDDLQRVWNFFIALEAVEDDKTAVVGASIGSNLSLVLGAMQPTIRTVVLLSPGLDYWGVTTSDQLAIYGERPILLVASRTDSYSANTVGQLLREATGEAELELYTSAGHGTEMFTSKPELADLILTWLNQYTQ